MTRKDQELLFENYKKIVLNEQNDLPIVNPEDSDESEVGFHGDELEDVDVDQQVLDDHLLKLIGDQVIGLTYPDEYLETAHGIAENLMDHFMDKSCVHVVDSILSYSGLRGPKLQTAKSLLSKICENPAKMFFSTKKKIKEKDFRSNQSEEPEEHYENEDGDSSVDPRDFGL
jgi:hypothetical protein